MIRNDRPWAPPLSHRGRAWPAALALMAGALSSTSVGAQATESPAAWKSFTQLFDWNELRGFYNLCDQEQATLQAVQAAQLALQFGQFPQQQRTHLHLRGADAAHSFQQRIEKALRLRQQKQIRFLVGGQIGQGASGGDGVLQFFRSRQRAVNVRNCLPVQDVLRPAVLP